MNLFLKKNSST